MPPPLAQPNTADNAKKAAATAAAGLIEDGNCVGLGTGSTAEHFIDALIRRCSEGLKITAVSSSKRSADRAASGGITVHDFNDVDTIDITVDGADEIDAKKRMIKGGGGALLREKLLASSSREMIVVVDASKVVDRLGAFPLPVEVVPFGEGYVLRQLERLGYHGSRRQVKGGAPYVTDNGNHIVDIKFSDLCDDPEGDDGKIRHIVGVVETGFFFGLAGRVVVGNGDGSVDILP